MLTSTPGSRACRQTRGVSGWSAGRARTSVVSFEPLSMISHALERVLPTPTQNSGSASRNTRVGVCIGACSANATHSRHRLSGRWVSSKRVNSSVAPSAVWSSAQQTLGPISLSSWRGVPLGSAFNQSVKRSSPWVSSVQASHCSSGESAISPMS